jgi:glucose-6-phosphate isomerase
MQEHLSRIDALVGTVQAEGYTHALLLGMGGSSLAPEVFRKVFGVQEGYLDLVVLDSTDPGAILAHDERLDLRRTLFIVSTKSGSTVETLSFFKYFYNRTMEVVGRDQAGDHFIAITDPGSRLEEIAIQYGFRDTFLNDPNIGGRYSALSYFGIIPAALIGVDVATLLSRTLSFVNDSKSDVFHRDGHNYGAELGAVIGKLGLTGRDKLTLITSTEICSFGDWVEQLIAESTGKEGKGILPVVGETLLSPEVYGDDRLFIHLSLKGDHTHKQTVMALENAGHPVVYLELTDLYDLGEHFFQWELATAIAGHYLGINPFDQPNVEAAKVLARKMVAAYQTEGILPVLDPTLQTNGITVYSDLSTDTLENTWKRFLEQAEEGAYLSVQAYIHPTNETDASLLELRNRLRACTRMAVTTGYGPRYLHSTGQLHKGDARRGLFIQITSETTQDIDIPDEPVSSSSSISFGVLKNAQALGDRQALLDAGRKVIRFHFKEDVLAGLAYLAEALKGE